METNHIRAAIAEDDPAFRSQLNSFLQQYACDKRLEITVSAFEEGQTLVSAYCPIFDVIFLDVEMPHLDGMSAAEKIRQKDSQVLLVFVTNVAHYAVKGYAVQALDYILKPLNYMSFSAKMDRIVKTLQLRQEKSILLNSGSSMRRIPVSQILYVEVLRHQVVYHLADELITVRGSLKEAENLLEGCSFEKCNSCYLVNLRHVRGVREDAVIVGQEELQMSRAKKKDFMQAVAAYISSYAG